MISGQFDAIIPTSANSPPVLTPCASIW